MSSIVVSVIIPVYGVEKYIEKCARSLFEQTLVDIEYLFVDDCTPDKSIEILKDVAVKYPERKIQILHQQSNKGVSAARELALSKANGKYLAFCDSDDWVCPNMYEVLVNIAEQNRADIVGCGFNEVSNGIITCHRFPQNIDDYNLIFKPECFGGIFGALWNKLIRRDFFEQESCALWKTITMWEDSCLLIPLRLHSKKTVFIHDCLYNYNINQSSMTATFSLRKVYDAIEATRRLENYFKENNFQKDSNCLIKFLKQSSKEVLLRYPNKENIQLWKNVFPESKYYIFRYHNWGILLKIRNLLVAYLPISLGIKLLKLKRNARPHY